MKTALITGISGQDGSYLAEYLLARNYRVFGLVRREPQTVRWLQPILDSVEFVYGDMRDVVSLEAAIQKSEPHELYNLAAHGFVPASWSRPAESFDVIVGGLARILAAVERFRPGCRVYQASSSEMFGNKDCVIDENTPMRPESPYGVAKLSAHQLADVYRRKGLFVVGGILFNHESPRRAPEIVTTKIVRAVARWARGDKAALELGDLTPRRDWGFAGDYVRAIHLMVQNDKPIDYVIATGKSHSVREFLMTALRAAGLDAENYMDLVVSKGELKRPNEIGNLCGCAARAQAQLGWHPTVSFEELVEMMVRAELASH